MVHVQVLGIHVDPTTGASLVILGENEETTKVLPIFIGPAEARAIVVGLRGIELPRPGTHELLAQLLERLHARVTSMTVTELHDDAFLAELGIEAPDEAFQLSVRPSDGIAIAIRAGIPLHVTAELLDDAGIEIIRTTDEPLSDEEVDAIVSEFQDFLATATPEDFEGPPSGQRGPGEDDPDR